MAMSRMSCVPEGERAAATMYASGSFWPLSTAETPTPTDMQSRAQPAAAARRRAPPRACVYVCMYAWADRQEGALRAPGPRIPAAAGTPLWPLMLMPPHAPVLCCASPSSNLAGSGALQRLDGVSTRTPHFSVHCLDQTPLLIVLLPYYYPLIGHVVHVRFGGSAGGTPRRPRPIRGLLGAAACPAAAAAGAVRCGRACLRAPPCVGMAWYAAVFYLVLLSGS